MKMATPKHSLDVRFARGRHSRMARLAREFGLFSASEIKLCRTGKLGLRLIGFHHVS
jgi:hypothetical protein